MRWTHAVLLAIVPWLLMPISTRAEVRPPVGYALVVTNNRSLDSSRPDLHYADDDGIQYAKLFSEVFGRERVILLTRPDAGTLQLHPAYSATAFPPTRQQLFEAIDRLAKSIRVDKKNGHAVAIHMVFAGHGDIHKGQGFIALEDERFTAADLDELIARLKADQVHLIIDSCNAYFMLNPRGPSVKRWSARPSPHQSLLRKYPHVGALISTSAEAVTYEWSELQSGIFSYEVRSALRGAADVDGKPGISYAEAAAFVHTSSKAIKNELYRPKVFVRGPSGNLQATIMPNRTDDSRVLALRPSARRRLTIRDSDGVRVLDVHKEPGTALCIHLPVGSDSLYIFEHRATEATKRPMIITNVIDPGQGDVDLDALPPHPDYIASRAEAPVFRDLFTIPFGRIALAQYQKVDRTPKTPTFGVSKRDIQRLDTHLRLSSKIDRHRRAMTGFANLSVGTTIIAIEAFTETDAPPKEQLQTLGVVLGISAFFFGWGSYLLIAPTRLERLYQTFLNADLSSSEARARALIATEKAWERQVTRERKLRRVNTILDIVVGSLLCVTSVLYAVLLPPHLESESINRTSVYIGAGALGLVGLSGIGNGLWHHLHPTPLEEAWRTYNAQ